MSNLLSQASLVMIPSGYKEDVVYSQIPTSGAGDLTFTRASNGTRINSAGLVEVVPWNLVTYSNDFSSSWALIESSKSTGVTDPIGNSNAIKLKYTTATSGHFITQGITLTGSTAHSVYAKAGELQFLQIASAQSIDEHANFNLSTGVIGTYGSRASNVQIESVGNGWYRCSVVFTSGSNGIYLAIVQSASSDWFGLSTYAGANATDGLYLYGGQINTGALKPYFPTTDRLNVPRLTYQNGGGGCPSLLLEKQSTNLSAQSQDFNGWANKVNITTTANYATSPDGTQNASRLQFTANGFMYGNTGFGQTSGTVYTLSCWAKRNGSGSQSVGFFIDGSGGVNSTWSLSSEYQRFTYTFTAGNNSTVGIAGASGADVSVWGWQFEASSYATSYIPTTSSSATRVADGSPDTATLLSNKLSYSVFLDFYPRPLGNFQYFFIQKNSSANAEIIWGGTSGGTDFAIYDYTAGSICNVAINDGNRHKIVLSQASGKIDVFVDGSQVATQKTTSATGFYYVAFDGNPGIYKINELAIMSKITNADAIALTTL